MRFFNDIGYVLITYWKDFLYGVGYTLLISIIATLLGLIIGLIIGVIRTIPKSKNKFINAIQKVVDFILSAYIEVFRGTPMMVQAVVIYWGYAYMTSGQELNLILSAIVIVSINTGAYIAEIVRGGILAVDKGQFEGAYSIGMTHSQAMFSVVIPQVLRTILPSVSNEFVINIKDTSVLNVIGVTELFFFTKLITKTKPALYFPAYFTCCIIYFILTFAITRIIRLVEKKLEGKKSYTIFGSQTSSQAEIHVKESR